MPEPQDPVRNLQARLGFLEDEHRETRLLAQKLQQHVDTVLNSQRDASLRHESLEHALNASRSQIARFPGLEEEVRQLRDRYSAIQEDVAAAGQMQDKLLRLQDVEHDRLRTADAEILNRVDSLVDQINEILARLAPVADLLRRLGDGITRLTHDFEQLNGKVDGLTARHGLMGEQLRRVELEIGRIEKEFDPLRAQDAVALNRVQITLDQVKRVDEQVQEISSAVAEVQELAERVQIYRIEHQRLEEQLGHVLSGIEAMNQRADEQARQVRTLEERRSSQQEHLLRLQQELSETRNELGNRVLETHQLQTQSRLRELGELERAVRELKDHENRLKGKLG